MAYGKRKRTMSRTRFGMRKLKIPYVKRTKPPAALALRRKTRRARPTAGVRLTRPMRSLVDSRVNAHLETRTIKASLWPQVKGTSYNLANHIDDFSVATIIPKIEKVGNVQEFVTPNMPFRSGNVIHPKGCWLRLRLWVDPGDTVTGPAGNDRCMIQPYVFVGTHRARKSYNVLTQNNWECLEEFWRGNPTFNTTANPNIAGTGDASYFTGERGDFTQGQLNRDKFSPIPGGLKTFALCRPLGWYANPVEPTAGGGFAIPLTQREFMFKIPMPNKLTYTDNDDAYPSNYCPFVAIGFTYMNGAAASLEKPLLVESSVTFQFTDA